MAVRRAPRLQAQYQNSTRPPIIDYLPHPLDLHKDDMPKPLTYVEQYQRRFSASFRDHWNWTEKLKDRTYFAKLLRDAQREDRWLGNKKVLTWRKEDIKMVYDDLVKGYEPYVASLREEGSSIEPDIDCVWREDDFLDNDGLRLKLRTAMDALRNIFFMSGEWRLTSEDQVTDFINPYCWPIVYGRSCISDTYDDIVVEPPNFKRGYYEKVLYSKKFCWLPSEFEVSSDGESTRIASYINNLALMPQERLLYPILEKIFTYFVPMFDRTLADIEGRKYMCRRVRSPPSDPEIWKLPEETYKRRWERLLAQFQRGEKLQENFDSDSSGGELEDEDEDEDPVRERRRSKPPPRQRYIRVRELATYKRKIGRRWEPPELSKSTSLKGQTVKVVVRLMDINLPPRSPNFVTRGGWMVEGVLNERIVATGIYCYSQRNIENAKIHFSVPIKENPKDKDWGLVHNLGMRADFQEVGATSLKIPTTRDIGPQQPDVRQEIDDLLAKRLPRELTAMILGYLPPVVPESDAAALKEAFLKERSVPGFVFRTNDVDAGADSGSDASFLEW
ncbi:hypothetical protein TWF703_009750 [Orbilia oligospora]|uniref:DUF4246 domain-containing protein n=1 Tax=Orbilia oligospora TaxID=2813651 RepID=A0A7C8JV37_ORBOL|nr:hypothetical protein TWF703_009750 [Orbilia oligospora]